MKIETLLVPTDFSPSAEVAFSYALEFAQKHGARIEVFHDYDLKGWIGLYELTFIDKVEAEIRTAAEKKLAPLLEKANAAGVSATKHLDFGRPSEAIVERAAAISADLIIMGTRGMGAAMQVLLGSVAERTVRDAPCPVVTVGPNVHQGE